MPIYEYICNDCGFEFEKIRSFSDSTTPICPSCEHENVGRKMGVPAIHFKGSGWYINDSKKSNKNSDSSRGSDNENVGGDKKNDSSSSNENSSTEDGKGQKTENKSTESKKSDSSSSDSSTSPSKTPKKAESSSKKSA